MTTEQSAVLNAEGLATAAGYLTVYNFDPQNGLFTGSSQEYLAQGIGIPAHSTGEAPPADVPGKACLFLQGKWQQVADHRGETVYSTKTGEEIIVTQPGEYPAGTTLLKPYTAFDKWGGTAWVTDKAAEYQAAFAAAQAEKEARISEAGRVTQAWQTQLLLGIITEADKASLTAWMKYIQAVQATDLTNAPDISWPQKPE